MDAVVFAGIVLVVAPVTWFARNLGRMIGHDLGKRLRGRERNPVADLFTQRGVLLATASLVAGVVLLGGGLVATSW